MTTELIEDAVKQDPVWKKLDSDIRHLEYLSKCTEWVRNVYHFACDFVAKSSSFPPLIADSEGTTDYAVASMLNQREVFGTIPYFLKNVWTPKRSDSWVDEYLAINPKEDKEFVGKLEKVLGITEKSVECGVVQHNKPLTNIVDYMYGVWRIFPEKQDKLFLIALKSRDAKYNSNHLISGRGNYHVVIKHACAEQKSIPALRPSNTQIGLAELGVLATKIVEEEQK